MDNKKYSWVTYLCDNSFLEGVLCLNKSLLNVNSKFKLMCMITQNVSIETRNNLKLNNIPFVLVEKIVSKRTKGIKDRYSDRSWMMFTKLNLWSLIDFNKIIYLDADILLLKNCDHLFDLKEDFYAVKDVGYNGINAGVMIIKPNLQVYNEMISLIDNDKYDNTYSDQSFTNWYFTLYKKKVSYLPIEYNVLQKRFSFENNFKNISIFHYNGQKPWIEDKDHKCFWKLGLNEEYKYWHKIRGKCE